MTWTEKTGFTNKQLFAIIMSIITLIGGLGLSYTNPGMVDKWFMTQTEMTREVIRAEIEDYIDQGLGGSPYQTEKSCNYLVNNLTVGATTYTYVLDGLSGKIMNGDMFSANKHNVLSWLMGNITAGTVVLKEVNWDITVPVTANVLVVEYLNSVESHYDTTGLIWVNDGGDVTMGDILNGYNLTDIGKQSLYPQQDYDYLIYTDNSTGVKGYYALSSSTGFLTYQGLDFSSVCQATISSLNGTGGVIFIKQGVYHVKSPIKIISDLTIGGVFSSDTVGSGTQLVCDVDCNIFEYNGPPTAEMCYIHDLYLKGHVGGASGSGIFFSSNAFDNTFERLYITYFPDDGIHLESTWGCNLLDVVCERNGNGMYLDGETGKLVGCELIANLEKGIYCASYGLTISTTVFQGNQQEALYLIDGENVIIGNWFSRSSHAVAGLYPEIRVVAPSSRNIITGNMIYCLSYSTNGVLIGASSKGNVITSNNIWLPYSDGISVNGNNNLISNNLVYNATLSSIYVSGTENLINDNYGYFSGTCGIWLNGDNNEAHDNYYSSCGTFGLRISNGKTGNDVKHNYFLYCTSGGVSAIEADNIIKDNNGYTAIGDTYFNATQQKQFIWNGTIWLDLGP